MSIDGFMCCFPLCVGPRLRWSQGWLLPLSLRSFDEHDRMLDAVVVEGRKLEDVFVR
jgi:hypothetical protein